MHTCGLCGRDCTCRGDIDDICLGVRVSACDCPCWREEYDEPEYDEEYDDAFQPFDSGPEE